MALIVATSDPNKLLADIKDKIAKRHIDTWVISPKGHFTHHTHDQQWENKAWFNPNILNNSLVFGLLGRKDIPMPQEVYGIYHGRFAEMLLTHFDNYLTMNMSIVFNPSYDFLKGTSKNCLKLVNI